MLWCWCCCCRCSCSWTTPSFALPQYRSIFFFVRLLQRRSAREKLLTMICFIIMLLLKCNAMHSLCYPKLCCTKLCCQCVSVFLLFLFFFFFSVKWLELFEQVFPGLLQKGASRLFIFVHLLTFCFICSPQQHSHNIRSWNEVQIFFLFLVALLTIKPRAFRIIFPAITAAFYNCRKDQEKQKKQKNIFQVSFCYCILTLKGTLYSVGHKFENAVL